MSSSSIPASSFRKSKKDDVEALLSDLDKLDPESAGHSNGKAGNNANQRATTAKADDAQSLLDDLDDLVKLRAPTPKKPSLRSTSSSKVTTGQAARLSSEDNSPLPTSTTETDSTTTSTISGRNPVPPEEVQMSHKTIPGGASQNDVNVAPSWGGWWSSATKLADQARAELEKRAAQVQSQVVDTAKEASGEATSSTGPSPSVVPWAIAQNVNAFLKNNRDLNRLRADFSKAGMKGWNELLNVVVPPIEKHEVLSVTLSHDMIGYDGINDVVFAVLQRVMETHASSLNSEQQLVVNKAPERSPTNELSKEPSAQSKRSMNAVVGFQRGWQIAEEKLSLSIQSGGSTTQPQADVASTAGEGGGPALPITTCPLYIRIQPVLDSLPGVPTTSADAAPTHLFLQLILRDPTNSLSHQTLSQPIPKAFIDLDFEEHTWVEDLLSESLQAALGAIGLEYIRGRHLESTYHEDAVEASTSIPQELKAADVVM